MSQLLEINPNKSYNLEILTTNICNYTCDFCDIDNYTFKKLDLESSLKTLDYILSFSIKDISLCAKEPILDSNFKYIYEKIKNYNVLMFSNASNISVERYLKFNFSKKPSLALTFHPSQTSFKSFMNNVKILIDHFNISILNIMNESKDSFNYFKNIRMLYKDKIKEIEFRDPYYNILTSKMPNNRNKPCFMNNIIFFNFINNTYNRCFPYNLINKKYCGNCESNFCNYLDYN